MRNTIRIQSVWLFIISCIRKYVKKILSGSSRMIFELTIKQIIFFFFWNYLPHDYFLRGGYGKKSVVHGLLEHLVEMFVIKSLLVFFYLDCPFSEYFLYLYFFYLNSFKLFLWYREQYQYLKLWDTNLKILRSPQMTTDIFCLL